MNLQLQYEYADGNGNVYLVASTSLEYVPVTPERSSSGTYSGGTAKKIELTDTEFQHVKSVIEKAIANTSAHQKDREMMTGLITAGNIRVVLKRNSSEKTEIEIALKELLEN